MLVHCVAAVVRPGRLLDAREILGEIAFVEGRIMFAKKGHHLAGDVAFVESIPRGDNAGGPSARFRTTFGLDHAA